MTTYRSWIVSIAFLLAVDVTIAQSTKGSILGQVRDASGAVIPGAEIEAREEGTNFTREVLTGEDGFYLMERLDSGTYTVQARMAGFKSFSRPGVRLPTNGQVRVEIVLQVGEFSDNVTVTEPSPVIETETGTISTILNSDFQKFNTAVSPNSNTFQILRLAGGVNGGSGITVNGSRGTQNRYAVDGTTINNPVTGGTVAEASGKEDATEEVQLITFNSPAEYASPVVVNATTKHATNNFHGHAAYLNQNSALAAKPFFAQSKSPGNRHSWIGQLGGPVILPGYNGRDKTFFFFSYEGGNGPTNQARSLSVPTEAMRAGDFSAFSKALIDPLTGQAFPGNKIPDARLNSSALKYLQRFYPRPNIPTVLPSGNYAISTPSSPVRGNYTARLDQKVGSRQVLNYSLNMHFDEGRAWERNIPPEFLGWSSENNSAQVHTLAHTVTLTPSMVNEFRIGYVRTGADSRNSLNGKEVNDLIGLTGFPQPLDPEVGGYAAVAVAGLLALTPSNQNVTINNIWDIHDHLTWVGGSHAFKTGINVYKAENAAYPQSPTAQFGSFNFDGFATGQAFGDFLLGIPRTASRGSALGLTTGRFYSLAGYFQDDWKVRSNLTLNLGIRYQYSAPMTDENDRIASFDPKTGSIVIPNEDVRRWIHPLFPATIPITVASAVGFPERSLVSGDTNNFAPRLGFAWRTGRYGIVIRGGFGVFHFAEGRKLFNSMVRGPFVGSETFDNSVTAGKPLIVWPQAFPTGGGARPLGIQDIEAVSPDLRDSYAQQWNLTVEKQFGDNGLRVSYVGTSSMQLPFRRNLNQPRPGMKPFSQQLRPYPIFRNIVFADNGGNQRYNSFQAAFSRRLVNGVAVDSAFGWAKNLTDSSDQGPLGDLIENAYDRRAEWGNDEKTARLRWNTNFIWEIPVGKGRHFGRQFAPVLDAIVGGWSVGNRVAFSTGAWLTPFYSGRDISGTNVTQGRPDRIADGNLPGDQRSLSRAFDTSAFVIPPAGIGRFGNSGKNIIEEPGQRSWDVRVMKYFVFKEFFRLRLESKIGNILNHPMFQFQPGEADQGMNLASSSVGRITRQGTDMVGDSSTNRTIVVGLRLEF